MIFDLPSDVFKKIVSQITVRDTASLCCTCKEGVQELSTLVREYFFDIHMFLSEIGLVIDKNLEHDNFDHSVKYSGENTKLIFTSRFPKTYKVKFQRHVTKHFYHVRKRMCIEDVFYALNYIDLKKQLKESILTNNEFMNTALYPISKRIKFST